MTSPRLQDFAQDIVAPPAQAAIFLTVTVNHGRENEIRDVLSNVAGLTRAVGFRAPEAQLTCVVAVGSDLWNRMCDSPRPVHLRPFAPIRGTQHTAVATPGDLFLHLRATRLDLCFELSRQLVRALGEPVVPVDEVHGLRYWDERDLLGFVDGTESPQSDPDVSAVALIGDQDPRYAGGSYVVIQKYLHDLETWERLAVAEQDRIVGREKLSNVELPDSAKPTNSHVAATTITDPDGTPRQIVRDNMPFGSAAGGEYGTYFIGYEADPGVIERLLHRMFVGEPGWEHRSHPRLLHAGDRLSVLRATSRAPRATRAHPAALAALAVRQHNRTHRVSSPDDPGSHNRTNYRAQRELVGHRKPEEEQHLVNNLRRELAPISPAAWEQIEEEARRTFIPSAAGRRIVDVEGPAGAAAVEERTIFYGFPNGGIPGITTVSSHQAVRLPANPKQFPGAVARALNALRLAAVGGPFALLSADLYSTVAEETDHGFPIREQLARLIDGELIWAPALNEALLVSTRGGDYTLHLGEDLSIGYVSHDTERVELYLEESLTFMPHTAETAIALTA